MNKHLVRVKALAYNDFRVTSYYYSTSFVPFIIHADSMEELDRKLAENRCLAVWKIGGAPIFDTKNVSTKV